MRWPGTSTPRPVTTSARTDLAGCADEPIHIPGAIQPHGWIVIGDAATGQALAYSRNWDVLFGPADADARRRLLETTLAAATARATDAGETTPAPCGTLEIGSRRLDATVHRSGTRCIVELEPAVPELGLRAPLYGLAQRVGADLQRAATIPELCRLALREIKRLSGFGRCLVYRFDADGHGHVIEELADPGYDAYRGHHFPASDIPPQARELYRLNHIRLIPDAIYEPVPLVSAPGASDPGPIDLSFASLRSVSPVHLAYMRNMGTLASMSVSLMVQGRLWGLLACHHHGPRHLTFDVRAACEHLGQLLSLQIEAKQDTVNAALQLDRRRVTLDLVARLHDSDASLRSLLDDPALFELVLASGAAVVLDEECWVAGRTPAPEQIAAISAWVEQSGRAVVASDALGSALPGLPADPETAGGVLAIVLSRVHRHHILWFRPEYVQTIAWAGEPDKPLDDSGFIHPRRSFATWYEEVRGRSLPWDASEIGAAGELREALLAIVLKRAQERAMLATELTRANAELEAFSYTVSHDLRAPMRHIAGFIDLVLDAEGAALGPRTRHYLAQAKEASAYAGQLVDALLDFSRLGRSSVKPAWIDTELLVDDLVRELALVERDRVIDWRVERPLPALWADPLLLKIVVRNLIGNAVKYTRNRSPAAIRIGGVTQPGRTGLTIEDNGTGFSMKYAAKLFGVFQRLHTSDEFEGTGIGLAIVRRVVERHGGEVTAHGEPGHGAVFTFTLPWPPEPASTPT